jgi:AcrR family transcriptional regulator
MPSDLRDRKKRETRQRISDVATQLFAENGFDAVTVEQVAAAAGVSKMTVFNYFPRKEDLVVDRETELLALVRDATAGTDPIGRVRDLFVGLAREGHPLLAAIPGAPAYWRLLASSPSLLARAWETTQEVEDAIALSLVSRGAGPAVAAAAAGMLAAVWRAAWRDGVRRVEAGEALDEVRARQVELLTVGMGAVHAAFGSGDTGTRLA